MKKTLFLLLTVLACSLTQPLTAAKQTAVQHWPDGSTIGTWFTDTSTPQLADLGPAYRLYDYGITSSPYVLQTEAIQAVIDKAAAAGGGVIVVPEGTFLTGALFFRPGVNLYLSKGAVLLGSEDISDYPIVMTRIEGEWCKYFSALINVEHLNGFTLSGEGTIDGNGSTYWRHFRLRREWNPQCTNKDEQRPRLLYVGHSSNVTIQGVTLQNSPFWTSHFYHSDSIRIQGVRYFNPGFPIRSASTDGIDLDVCHDVHISDCSITVNDDAICLKGGKGPDANEIAENGPCERILVERTTWNSSITCGSECLAVRNLLVRQCQGLDASCILRLKMRPDTPQDYSYITMEDLEGHCKTMLAIDTWRQFFNLKGRTERPRSYANHVTFRRCSLLADRDTVIGRHPDEYEINDLRLEEMHLTATPRLSWPDVTREAKPWSRWWWLSSAYSQTDVDKALAQYAEVGLGGLEVTNIYGTIGAESKYREFLGKDWVDLFVYTLQSAEQKDLGIDLANASGWPFGGPWMAPEDVCRTKVPRVWHLDGGQQLQDKVTCHQERMLRGYNVPDDKDSVLFPLNRNTPMQLQRWGLEQARPERDLPLIVLTANGPDGKVIDLTKQVAADGTLRWTAPEGHWTLTALFEGDHGKLVERAGLGGEGDVMDHFSSRACLNFLRKFDEAFKGRDIKTLRYYFNDSYEVDDAQGMSDWTPRLFEEFRQRRGYDLRQHLPALLGEDTPEKNNRVTYDFRQTIEDLILEKYTETWHDWATRRGKGIRNQAHGSPANILDLYAVADVPEIEGRDLISIKTAPSAAHVTGKRLISSESATWLNEHFLGRLGDVKQALDLFFLGGVNHVFYHGTCFSPADADWPGWMFYAAAHFEPNNPWWSDFRHLNEYVTRTQSWLQQGRADCDVLVYYNITDLQAQYDTRRPLRHFAGLDREMQESHTRQCVSQFDRLGYCWDMISDLQIRQLRLTADGQLATPAGASYRAIVIPQSRQMPYETLRQLFALARQGAHVIFEGEAPNDVAGYLDYAARNAQLKEWVAEGKIEICPDIKDIEIKGARPESSLYADGLLCTRRLLDDGSELYFIANRMEKDFAGNIMLNPAQQHPYAAIYNPMDGRMGMAHGGTKENDYRDAATGEVYLQLRPGESLIVRLFDQRCAAASYPFYQPQDKGQTIALDKGWQLKFVEGGPSLPAARNIDHLGSWTEYEDCQDFAGTAEYRITLPENILSKTAYRLSLGDLACNASVYLDGQYLGTVLAAPYELDIPASQLRAGAELTVRVANGMGNRIAAIERQGVQWQQFYNINMSARRPENRSADGYFTAKNWQPLPSGLFGPVQLIPLR